MLVFEERGHRSTWRKTSRSREENQQQTQPTRRAWEWNPEHIGGRSALSPLLHPCYMLYAPLVSYLPSRIPT